MKAQTNTQGTSGVAKISMAFCGVVLPLVGVLVQALRHFGIIPLSSEIAADLTQGGRFWVHPERDVQIYVLAVGVLLVFMLSLPWNRLTAKETPNPMKTGFPDSLLGFVGALLFLTTLFIWRKDAEYVKPSILTFGCYAMACFSV